MRRIVEHEGAPAAELQDGVQYSILDILTNLEDDSSVVSDTFAELGIENMWEDDQEEAATTTPMVNNTDNGRRRRSEARRSEGIVAPSNSQRNRLFEEMEEGHDSIDYSMLYANLDDLADDLSAGRRITPEDLLPAPPVPVPDTISSTRRQFGLFRPWRIQSRSMP